MDFRTELKEQVKQGKLNERNQGILELFFSRYLQILSELGVAPKEVEKRFSTHIELVSEQYLHPHSFSPFHQAQRAPFDYAQYSWDWVEPLIDFSRSKLLGEPSLAAIEKQLERGENAILLSNHQVEPDPQVLYLLLRERFPLIAQSLIFVAGHRVTQDPLSIPFSLGTNLICIYSKKYIEDPPEQKGTKQEHNRRAMHTMSKLLEEGGKCIWVAPSGGRDRRQEDGTIRVAPFHPSSVDMFALMARQGGTPTHFYPLTLSTYDLLPPPDTVHLELGELRLPARAPVYLSFGEELDFQKLGEGASLSKREQREKRADAIWKQVEATHQSFFE